MKNDADNLIGSITGNAQKKRRFTLKPLIAIGAFILALCLIAFVVIPNVFTLSFVSGGERAAYTIDWHKPAETPVLLSPSPADVPSPVPSPTVSNETLFVLGDESDEIAEIQCKMMDLGYLGSDEPSTVFNSALEAAVKLFQRTHHLNETGAIDGVMMHYFDTDTALPYIMEQGNRGNDILLLQRRLNELGFYTDMQNGYFGSATYNAVIEFQTVNGIAADGAVDRLTSDILFSPKALNSSGITPTEAPLPTKSPTPSKSPKPTPTPKPTPKPSETPGVSPSSSPKPSASSTPTQPPEPTQAPQPTEAPQPPVGNGSVEELIAMAYAQLGKPYVWSTEGPDTFDCSGLVYYCLRSIGLSVHRYSAQGFSEVSSWQMITNQSNLRRGDLVFFSNSSGRITHVGIYLGQSSYIHASSSAGKVVISQWAPWAQNNFALARRIWD